MLGRVTLVRTDASEELSASFIRVTRIGELGTTLVVTSNRRTLVFLRSVRTEHTYILWGQPVPHRKHISATEPNLFSEFSASYSDSHTKHAKTLDKISGFQC
jgi:hypothetical protein